MGTSTSWPAFTEIRAGVGVNVGSGVLVGTGVEVGARVAVGTAVSVAVGVGEVNNCPNPPPAAEQPLSANRVNIRTKERVNFVKWVGFIASFT
jgi:hypothetical protein